MKGLILNNAYYETPSTRYQGDRLKEELNKLGVDADIRKNDLFLAEMSGGNIFNKVKEYDFCIFLDKDKYASYALEKNGLKLFNSHSAIQACDDKAVTFLKLSGLNIPMPETLPGLLCYDPSAPVLPETCEVIAQKLGFPLIVKQCFGSLGKFVYKIDDMPALKRICEELKCVPHLFQKFVAESAGRDIRVICVGGEAVAAMKRTSLTDFRSNIELGGKGEPAETDEALRDICERTAKALKLDYCGIDVLFGKNGYLLCEVNSNAFFGGMERATGINVAKIYAEHIVKTMDKHRRN